MGAICGGTEETLNQNGLEQASSKLQDNKGKTKLALSGALFKRYRILAEIPIKKGETEKGYHTHAKKNDFTGAPTKA